jgi:tRNA-specific 2-thiouridylase
MKKVVVAMSGGVDSSVAAALLKEQGYEVIGITLKTRNWDDTEGRKFGGCCGSSDFYDARSVAQALDIPHYNFDYVDTFRQKVIGYFKDSYMAGETPNPCIACNQHVKFDRLLQQAHAFGADFLATGHYARIEHGSSARLKKAVDGKKDQSYVLYHLGQEELSKLLFPVGDFAKPEIREIARKYGLITAEKPDSQEICFVPNNDYRQFVADEIPAEQRPAGVIRHKNGKVLGQHQGLPFYTIGQRSGLGLAVGRPLYVVDIQKDTNTVVVGEKEDVYAKALEIREVSWVSGEAPKMPAKVSVKIRYKHTEASAQLEASSPSRVVATFEVPQSAITPGQAAVFYNGDVVLGGGVIDHVVRESRPAFEV